MKRLHYFTGLIITVFVGLHLFNHFVSIFGAEAHIHLMNKLRFIYRNIIVETILLIAVIIQIITGLNLFFSKRKIVKGFYEKMQVWTGLYLAFFLIMHISAVLVGRYILNLDTNFYFGAAGLNTFPMNLFFIPYYGLAVVSFFGHAAAIHYHKMKKKLFGLTVEQQSKIILINGFIATLIIFYGLTNGFSGIEIPKEFNIMIGK